MRLYEFRDPNRDLMKMIAEVPREEFIKFVMTADDARLEIYPESEEVILQVLFPYSYRYEPNQSISDYTEFKLRITFQYTGETNGFYRRIIAAYKAQRVGVDGMPKLHGKDLYQAVEGHISGNAIRTLTNPKFWEVRKVSVDGMDY